MEGAGSERSEVGRVVVGIARGKAVSAEDDLEGSSLDCMESEVEVDGREEDEVKAGNVWGGSWTRTSSASILMRWEGVGEMWVRLRWRGGHFVS